MSFEILVRLVIVALLFDFMNGFHDSANSIATIVSTGAMSPQKAVGWAALFNFYALGIFGWTFCGLGSQTGSRRSVSLGMTWLS